MAQPNTDITLQVDATNPEVKEKVAEREGGADEVVEAKSVGGSSSVQDSVEKSAGQGAAADAQSTVPPPRPSLVPLGSAHAQSSTSAPKRFSAMNINKKFLEKTTASISPSSTSSASSIAKGGTTAARAAVQQTSSHPKLVAAKLTAGSTVSSTPAGWSRSPSVAPSPVPTSNSPNSASPLPATPSIQSSTTAAPQFPHVGKVIQPQPRAAITQLNSSKETGSTKLVWGNIKHTVVGPIRSDIQPNDFPTAAEVANVATTRKQPKTEDIKAPAKPPSKQLRSEEADTFRGVHLDPNAHHWDEMEEDDDNFLNGVIEFGDGRQYKIDTSESRQPVDSTDPGDVPSYRGDKLDTSDPVTKEERFVDDFDRSWPRSKGSPSSSSKEFGSNTARSASPKAQSGHSPREFSRVLFNERSNRLEPYGQPSHRPGQGPFGPKRPSLNEGSPVDGPRGVRESSQNFQVLRKTQGPEFPRSRRFSSSSSGYGSATNGYIGGHREGRREGPPPSPRMARDQSSLPPEGPIHDRSRWNSMGPPPLPPNSNNSRQLPPHLSPVSAPRRLSSRDSQLFSPSEATQSAILQSPSMSHTSVSPRVGSYATLSPSVIDIDEVRKDVMHNAAERAKARRQLEEEEREAQKERARRKAVEIEERMKAEAEADKVKQKQETEVTKESEVMGILDAALEAVESAQPSSKDKSNASTSVPPISSVPRRSSIPAVNVPSQPVLWRARPNPPQNIHGSPSVDNSPFTASGPSAVEQVASIAVTEKELEVVDFSEMGKFVGIPEPSESEKLPEVIPVSKPSVPLQKVSRPSASDFFDDTVPIAIPDVAIPETKSADFGAWRRKVEVSTEMKHEVTVTKSEPSVDTSALPEKSTTKEPLSPLDVTQSQTVHVPGHHVPQRPSLRASFKEAPMSALDDTMLRIKGVLVGMHAHDSSQEESLLRQTSAHSPPSRQGRWVRPGIRVQNFDDSCEPREVFLVTIVERPTTPPPVTRIPVQLPSVSRPVQSIHKKLLHAFHRPPPPARMEILSFHPPVFDMRRTWSLNEALFPSIAATFKPNFKYRVILPKCRGYKAASLTSPTKPNSMGAFGRSNVADGVVSWRKPVTPISTHPEVLEEPSGDTILNTTSRSPPPENPPPENATASIPRPVESSSTKSDSTATVRARPPKMPEGSAVAFMRDSRVDVVERSPRPLVNFIVGSELEDPWLQAPAAVSEPVVNTTSRVVPSPLVTKVELKHEPDKLMGNGTLPPPPPPPPPSEVKEASTKVDGNLPSNPPIDLTVDHGLKTPPKHQSPWLRSTLNLPVKESPSRAPDPEHLKAVWSQPSSKTDIKPVNSLEGIADDLVPLPFVLPEVKSGEGTTPSPSLPSAPSRMSIHEVTRAFQQVPTSTTASSQPSSRDKAQISPPTTNAPVARPTPSNPASSYPYPPLTQNNIRPMYYPSAMMAPSPAPVMYGPMASSPVQNRLPVNGHPAVYNTWIPTPQPPTNLIRSPYPMVPYPSAGYTPQPTAPNLMAPQTPQTQGAGRGRGMVMSPSIHPIPYAGSPVLMHPRQNHGYMSVPTDRGQLPRTDNNHHLSPQHSHPSLHSHPPPGHAGFNPGPPSPFTRAW